MNVANELFEVLDTARKKFPNDFNILDLNAGYREQKGLQSEAIPFRESQLKIEPRHPRVWLSYAYDLKAVGRIDEARKAFSKVKEFDKFLSEDIKSQMSAIENDFAVPK